MPSTATRVFLLLSAIVWVPYGLYCFVTPSALDRLAGVAASTATGTIELRAMYGGLQAALGLLALLGGQRAAFARPALIALAFLCAGLGSARLAAAVVSREVGGYTACGLAFEWMSALIALALLRARGTG